MNKFARLCIMLLIFVLIYSGNVQVNVATVKLQLWTLMDTGGHLDWRDDGTMLIRG